MSYQSGFRHCRVTIRNKVVATGFGETTSYKDVKTVWAAKTWKHGAKALREGALDAYDKVLFDDVSTKNDGMVIDTPSYCDAMPLPT